VHVIPCLDINYIVVSARAFKHYESFNDKLDSAKASREYSARFIIRSQFELLGSPWVLLVPAIGSWARTGLHRPTIYSCIYRSIVLSSREFLRVM
jgi:hypothetical protein